MKIYRMNVHLTFTEDVLGTCSANKELHSEFIASKAPDAQKMEEEIAAIGASKVEEKAMTVFPRAADGIPFLYDYQVKGFFKGTCGFLRKVPGTVASGMKAYKKTLDGLLFVAPREIELELPEGMSLGDCQRPLRAETPQGERIALAHSETAPAGTEIDFSIDCLTKEVRSFVREALDYGRLSGIGQWRNSGAGRFEYEIVSEQTIENKSGELLDEE